MTTVKFKRQDKQITGFTVSGHTGFAAEGEDIVCASVSSVVWCTINGLSEVAGLPVTYETQDGYVSCNLPALSASEAVQADVLLESMLAFCRTLSEQYPDFVNVMEV